MDTESGHDQVGEHTPAEERRLQRELRTVAALIRIYCRKKHGSVPASCAECGGLLRYAEERIRACPHLADKPPCRECTTKCYRQAYKDRIREVMAFTGPRMIASHPVLAIQHLLAGRKRR